MKGGVPATAVTAEEDVGLDCVQRLAPKYGYNMVVVFWNQLTYSSNKIPMRYML